MCIKRRLIRRITQDVGTVTPMVTSMCCSTVLGGFTRTEFESYVSMPLTMENLIEAVTKKEKNWTRFQAFSRKIMQERQLQEMIVKRRKRQASRLN